MNSGETFDRPVPSDCLYTPDGLCIFLSMYSVKYFVLCWAAKGLS